MPISPKLLHAFAGAALAVAALPFPAEAAQPTAQPAAAPAEGVIRLRSANGFDDTVARLKADIQAKGIRFFDQIDQAALATQADLKLGRSTLMLFGNPPLGVQFLQTNPYAGLDWPVRMLVIQEADSSVWVAWTDFGAMAKRYRISGKQAQCAMASDVARSIATAATTR